MEHTSQIGYLLQHTATALVRHSDEILQERFGIGYSQYKILLNLAANPSVQQRTIAKDLAQTEASISRQVKIMLDKGLLKSRVNPKNRREHIIVPTVYGRKTVAKATEALDYYYAPVFAGLSSSQQIQLIELLSSIHYGICAPH